jgi:hypothetical protein
VPPRSRVFPLVKMTRISTIPTVLLVLAGLAALAPKAEGRQFRKPVYYQTNANVWGILAADFNHDGILDLAFTDLYQVGIMLGKGDGTFESPRYFSAPDALQLAVGDFNGDHNLDLAVLEYGGTGHSALGIFLGDGQGNFNNIATYEVGVESPGLTVADFDGDGHLDLAVANERGYGKHGNGGAVLVFSGKGDGTFRKPDVYKLWGQPYGIAAGDFNGDHHPDLAVAQAGGRSVTILMNNGHGKFRRTKTYQAGNEADYVAVADLDRNGTLDLVVSAAGSNKVAVLLGKGDGTFGKTAFYSTAALGQGPIAVAIADFNRDGNLDIAVVLANGYPGLFYGNGDGTFQKVRQIKSVRYRGYALTAGDFNKDGKPDLAVVALSKGIAILINAQ